MLKFLLEKEFKQLLRGGMLPGILIMMPLMMMGLFPWAANMEMRNINVTVVDNDHSSYSSRLTGKVDASRYLHLESAAESYGAAMHRIERGSADLILEIPEHFERDITRDGMAPVMISANAVNGMKGSLGSIYASSVAMDFATEIAEENRAYATATDIPVVEVIPQNKFNPHMDYKVFMVPALEIMRTDLENKKALQQQMKVDAEALVAEKEAGTIEQINVTPVGKFTFILAKLIPYWSIGFFVLTLCFGLARLFYGLAPAGSIVTIYAAAGLFVLTISGFGLMISNHSDTMQQATFVMMFFMVILILLSGLFTPISSMPQWAQDITILNPLKYLMQVMRLVYLKGSPFSQLTVQFAALAIFAVVLNLWAVLSYRKNS